MPEVNENGWVALRHYKPGNHYISFGSGPGFREYLFEERRGVSLAWIRPEDVERTLAIRVGGCCGNTPARVCHLATARDVDIWLGRI